MAQTVKCLSTMWETRVWSLNWEDPLEYEIVHSRTIAWKIPWTEEPGRLQSMRSQRVGHGWATSLCGKKLKHQGKKQEVKCPKWSTDVNTPASYKLPCKAPQRVALFAQPPQVPLVAHYPTSASCLLPTSRAAPVTVTSGKASVSHTRPPPSPRLFGILGNL